MSGPITTAQQPEGVNPSPSAGTTQQRTRGFRRRPPRQADSAVAGGASPSQKSSQSVSNLRPSSFPPASDRVAIREQAQRNGSANSKSRLRGGRGRGRGGQSRLADNESQPGTMTTARRVNVATGHVFAGALTTPPTGSLSQPSSVLHADAPEFRPGDSNQKRGTGRSSPARIGLPSRAQKRRFSKSSAPDIATRTHQDITNGFYECPICTNEVATNSKVWSCKTCWTVFHLGCIKRWSKNEGSTQVQQRPQEGDAIPTRNWRCPGCNLPKDILPQAYTCWCEKEVDPVSYPGLPPHSCGQTCGKHRVLPKACPHPCELLCHAGPCPPCPHAGPMQMCFCGQETATRKCVDTDYEHGWSCGKVCGELMPCGEHHCPQKCHEGLCGACEVEMEVRCYCGKLQKLLPCCDRADGKESSRPSSPGNDTVETWLGMLSCGSQCGRPFDCGQHHCEKDCHVQTAELTRCPRSPDLVTHCACGKTSLSSLSEEPRLDCRDPIPNCQEKCLKVLACGHLCQQVCHAGECLPCLQTISILCRCGRTTSSTICHQGSEERPQCLRACRATLNCGRHDCGERCCPGERRAAERQSGKRRARPLDAAPRVRDADFEAEHICTRACGRLLKCGTHTCTELCHKGPCGSCREAIFEELSCDCGRTILQPPLPCGTKPPPCRYQCERAKRCRHPQVAHTCHSSDESCPKCPFLTEKPCMCGRRTLKNQQCWLSNVRCGETCGAMLRCGSHYCREQCHLRGECEDAGKVCSQPCGKSKKACGHPCEEPCHAPYPCREQKSCPSKMLITCECQHLKQEVRCNASKSSEGNITKSLSCDDECARLERNRKLALALEIDPETHKDDHIPYSKETLTRYSEDIKWAQSQERIFRVFAADDTERRLRLKPMPAGQRSFVHALAEDFGLDSESMDPEPRRHVAIFKTPRFVTAPMKTLAQAAQIRMLADPTGALEAQKRQASAASSVANAAEAPFNGFILDSPRFGLTIEEVHSTVDSDLSTLTEVSFDIQFLPSEEILIRSNVASTANEKTIEGRLKSLKPSILRHVTGGATSLAQSVQMCRSDASYNILRREGQFGNGTGAGPGGGWSQVAAKAAAPRMAPTIKGVGGGSLFTVLGRRTGTIEEGKKAKVKAKKKATEEVVEDWEKAVEEEEKIEWEKSQEDEGLEVGKVPSASVTADLPKAGDTNFDDDQGEKAGSKEMADRTILAEQPLEKNEGAQYGQEQVQRARLEVDGALGQADVQGRTD